MALTLAVCLLCSPTHTAYHEATWGPLAALLDPRDHELAEAMEVPAGTKARKLVKVHDHVHKFYLGPLASVTEFETCPGAHSAGMRPLLLLLK